MKDLLLGFAVGDAFGVPVEFMSREDIRKLDLKDMIGCDIPHNFFSRWSTIIPAGAWSDDTSMLISSMDSIITNDGRIDYQDIMQNFVNWWYTGEYTSLDSAFGLGQNVSEALRRYRKGTPALECGGKSFMDNGNGALMRILPFSYYCIKNNMSLDETQDIISKASGLTHGHDISKMSCLIYTEILRNILNGIDKYNSIKNAIEIDYSKYFSEEAISANKRITSGDILKIKDEDIKPSGYVVDTLESVIYSILNGNDYESTILTAVNLGYDTDTVGGITGSLASALYGKESIPQRWTNRLKKYEYLSNLADKFDAVLEKGKSL